MNTTTLPLLQNIRAQPETLRAVLAHQATRGRPALEEVAQAICRARRVVVAAIGASYCAAIPLVTHLAGAGVDASLVDAAELLHYGHPAFADGTLFLLISRSGASVEIARLLPLLRRQHAQVVGVTDVRESVLGQEADTVLWLASRPDQMVAVQSYVATLLTLYLLGQMVRGQPVVEMARAAEEAIAAMARALPAWEARSEEWVAFLEEAAPLYLLGRGASLGSATEGALLFHEVAKQPAVALSAGAFRHGPVEVVDERFRALLFAPADETRSLNLALARELAALGGRVRLVGPPLAGGQSDFPPAWEIESVSPALMPLLEILPVQLSAFRLAGWKGIVPGSFRVLEQVIRSETELKPDPATS